MTTPTPRLALAVAVLGASALLASGASAGPEVAPLGVGARLGAFSLPDQHGESRAVDESTRILLFSRDMDGGRVIREVLEDDGAALLERKGAVYVADVHRMPGLVRRIVALPRMRRRPYPVLLDEEGPTTERLPSEKGRGTVIFLEELELRRIEFVENPEALRALLGGEPPTVEGAPMP